jgi:hypothetical protein
MRWMCAGARKKRELRLAEVVAWKNSLVVTHQQSDIFLGSVKAVHSPLVP